jgi:hypothetical protein
MLFPNSKAQRPIAAENPNIKANATQRKGHGKAPRTVMLGALIVRRRRSKRKRMVNYQRVSSLMA